VRVKRNDVSQWEWETREGGKRGVYGACSMWHVACRNSDSLTNQTQRCRSFAIVMAHVKRYFSCQFMLQLFQIKSMPKDLTHSNCVVCLTEGVRVQGIDCHWFMFKGLSTHKHTHTHSHTFCGKISININEHNKKMKQNGKLKCHREMGILYNP